MSDAQAATEKSSPTSPSVSTAEVQEHNFLTCKLCRAWGEHLHELLARAMDGEKLYLSVERTEKGLSSTVKLQ